MDRRQFLKTGGIAALALALGACGDSKDIQMKERSAELLDLKVKWHEYTDKRDPSNPVIYHSTIDGRFTGVEVIEDGKRIEYYKVRDKDDAFRANTGGYNFRREFVPASTDKFAVPEDDSFWSKFEDKFREVRDVYHGFK